MLYHDDPEQVDDWSLLINETLTPPAALETLVDVPALEAFLIGKLEVMVAFDSPTVDGDGEKHAVMLALRREGTLPRDLRDVIAFVNEAHYRFHRPIAQRLEEESPGARRRWIAGDDGADIAEYEDWLEGEHAYPVALATKWCHRATPDVETIEITEDGMLLVQYAT